MNDSEPARDTWRAAAATTGTDLVFVVLALDDVVEHRRRVETRLRDMAHLPEPSWEQVMARAVAYAPWAGECLRIDAGQPVDRLVAELVDRLAGV